jgi:hypothetical protein
MDQALEGVRNYLRAYVKTLAATLDNSNRTQVLLKQADELIAKLGANTDDAEAPPRHGSRRFRDVCAAYERLAAARKEFSGSGLKPWEVTRVDGRTGEQLMALIWKLRGDLEVLGEHQSV